MHTHTLPLSDVLRKERCVAGVVAGGGCLRVFPSKSPIPVWRGLCSTTYARIDTTCLL